MIKIGLMCVFNESVLSFATFSAVLDVILKRFMYPTNCTSSFLETFNNFTFSQCELQIDSDEKFSHYPCVRHAWLSV